MGLMNDRSEPKLHSDYDQELPGWTPDDVIGWPLAIRAYRINPNLGTAEDVQWLREELHSRGMKLMLDFVPNHTAVDAEECSKRPGLYIHSDRGDRSRCLENGIAYSAGSWMDPMHFAAQLNLFNADARNMQLRNLVSIAQMCDGVRVHVAYYWITSLFEEIWKKETEGQERPPTEFWLDAIKAAKAVNGQFILLGETYGEDVQRILLDFGFDYVYEKDVYDCLIQRNLEAFRRALTKFDNSDAQRLAHFVENHDECRAVSAFGNDPLVANAAAASILTLPGLRLIYHRQWTGVRTRLDVHLRRALSDDGDVRSREFYDLLFSVLSSAPLRFGDWTQTDVEGASNVLSWIWRTPDEGVLIVINFSQDFSHPQIPFVSDDKLKFTDFNTNTEVVLPLRLNPWQVQVLRFCQA
jgi:hypothetical protein